MDLKDGSSCEYLVRMHLFCWLLIVPPQIY